MIGMDREKNWSLRCVPSSASLWAPRRNTLFSRRTENRKAADKLRTDAYVDFVMGCAGVPTWSGDRLPGFAKQNCVFAILRIDWDRVPKTKVALYREEGGSCPFIEWFDKLPAKVQDKCYLRLERLREMGHELRRPEADFLRDGIYELRVSLGGVHHRILYFFHGAVAAVVSHGLAKERVVPPKEIDRAVERKKRFEANPAKHTYEEA